MSGSCWDKSGENCSAMSAFGMTDTRCGSSWALRTVFSRLLDQRSTDGPTPEIAQADPVLLTQITPSTFLKAPARSLLVNTPTASPNPKSE